MVSKQGRVSEHSAAGGAVLGSLALQGLAKEAGHSTCCRPSLNAQSGRNSGRRRMSDE